MSMPIQRQSEAFGIFDDGPRYARDRSDHDLPKGLAGLLNSMGPRIQTGMLNTRQAGWHTPDYDPRVDGYAPDGYAPSRSDFAEEDAENARRRNYPRGYGPPHDYDKYGDPDPDLESMEETADPDRFLPDDHVAARRRGSGRHPFDRTAGRRFLAFDWQQQQYDPNQHTSYEQKLFSDVELHKAPLENGHELHAWRYTQHPDDKEGWQWAISDPSRSSEYGSYPDDGDGGDWSNYDGSPPQISTWLAAGGVGAAGDADLSRKHRRLDLDVAHADHIPTLEHAKAQAQEHYQKMFPIGTSTGGHDSGADYSDLNSYMRHLESMRRAAGHPGPVPWEQTDEGWHNPGTGIGVRPSEETPGHWQMWSPAATMSRSAPSESKLHDSHPDPQVLMDWHDYQQGGEPPSWHERPRRMRDNMFPPSDLGPRTALAPSPDPAAMAPQMPVGGGFLPAHRVGLDWRDHTVPGTVIGVDDQVHVRWDDGQYTSEEPHEVHLL